MAALRTARPGSAGERQGSRPARPARLHWEGEVAYPPGARPRSATPLCVPVKISPVPLTAVCTLGYVPFGATQRRMERFLFLVATRYHICRIPTKRHKSVEKPLGLRRFVRVLYIMTAIEPAEPRLRRTPGGKACGCSWCRPPAPPAPRGVVHAPRIPATPHCALRRDNRHSSGVGRCTGGAASGRRGTALAALAMMARTGKTAALADSSSTGCSMAAAQRRAPASNSVDQIV